MKLSDIQKLADAGYLSAEQQQQIIQQFGLKEEGNRFLAIISMIGAVLIGAGLILMLAANWDEIPRLVKIALGIVLMTSAHGVGWYLREGSSSFPKTGEALHLLGSLLFLGNIALLGQIYHLPGDPPDAILGWLMGIAALPWLLRSRAQYMLVLLGFGVWVLLKAMEPDSFPGVGQSEWLLLLLALLGGAYYGAGCFFYRARFREFAGPTQKLGLLAVHVFSFPMTWGFGFSERDGTVVLPLLMLYVVAAGFIVLGAQRDLRLSLQWRWTWAGTLAGVLFVLSCALFAASADTTQYTDGHYHWFVTLALFVLCLVQINVALQIQSAFYLNLAIVFVALHIIATYLILIGSMAQTGFMFLISGVFLLVFGLYLEKKRRALMSRIRTVPPPPLPVPS